MRQLRGAASGRRRVDVFSRARLARLLSAFEHSTQAHARRGQRYRYHHDHRHGDGILQDGGRSACALGLSMQLGGSLYDGDDDETTGTEAILSWLGLRNMR